MHTLSKQQRNNRDKKLVSSQTKTHIEPRGGGGGQKTKWKTPSSKFEELIESITNMLLFFAGGSRKKSYEVLKFGGGVYALNEFFEKKL